MGSLFDDDDDAMNAFWHPSHLRRFWSAESKETASLSLSLSSGAAATTAARFSRLLLLKVPIARVKCLWGGDEKMLIFNLDQDLSTRLTNS